MNKHAHELMAQRVSREDMDGALARHHQETARLPWRERALRRLAAIGVGSVVALGSAAAQDIVTGVRIGQQEVAGDQPRVHTVAEYQGTDPLLAEHGTFVLTGLGTKNPLDTAALLTQHQGVGSVYAVEYSNNDLDTDMLAQKVIEQAHASQLRYVSFDGYSAGGPISLAIGAYIRANEPDLDVTAVTLNSSPLGPGGLTEKSETTMQMMNDILSIYPDFVYYKRGRHVIETIARSERYLEVDGACERFDDGLCVQLGDTKYELSPKHFSYDVFDVRHKLSDPSTASADLMRHQADFIIASTYEDDLATLMTPRADDRANAVPMISYTYSADPTDDTVVDVLRSHDNLQAAMRRYGAPLHTYAAPVGHANPTERTDEYQRLIRQSIQPRLRMQIIAMQPVYGPRAAESSLSGS